MLLEGRCRNFGDPPLLGERARIVGLDLVQRLHHRGICQQRCERRLGGARRFLGTAAARQRPCRGETEQSERRSAFHITTSIARSTPFGAGERSDPAAIDNKILRRAHARTV